MLISPRPVENCEDFFSLQLHELVALNHLRNNLDSLYHNKIGTLYDEFNIEIPQRFEKEYDFLWSEDTIKSVKAAAEVAAGILNEVRVKPKPYQPLSSEDVKNQLKAMEKAIVSDMFDQAVACLCEK